MKISLNWLREWIELPQDAHEVAHRLTMAGIECEATPLMSAPLDGVVVAKIVEALPHPHADKLRVCRVEAGDGAAHQIVCGAPNARAGLLAPLALPGAVLPGGRRIGRARLRGVESGGMLCSARELALSEDAAGLMELPPTAVPGTPLAQQLELDDWILDLEFTPNRGDALSVLGLARELAAVCGRELRPPAIEPLAAVTDRSLPIDVEDDTACPFYAGRLIEGVNPSVATPQWMRERLRRAGVRSLGLLVDVTNYVLYELGQPMHAFDAARLSPPIRVRRAGDGETLRLLNGQTVVLRHGELLVADARGALALAGVMGGGECEVSEATTDVFLESACFSPAAVAGTGRRHKLHTDAGYRFERGVDPALQRRAIERASRLIVELAGGRAGPVVLCGTERPPQRRVRLRQSRLEATIGSPIAAATIPEMLGRLGIELREAAAGVWEAAIPSWRYDLEIEADLIEEVARLHGYERIEAAPYDAALAPPPLPESILGEHELKDALAARGYHEAVTYSFVDAALQARLNPGVQAVALENPIAETMAVMRTTLWAGLLPALQYNLQRQARRVRLFELGSRYQREADGRIVETPSLSGVVWGDALPEQWGVSARRIDFYDVKGDLEALLEGLEWRTGSHPALHPGQCAELVHEGTVLGWLGTLHPRQLAALDLPSAPVLFELDWHAVRRRPLPKAPLVSEYPQSRRDLAVSVPQALPAQRLVEAAREAGSDRLREVRVFDVYHGAGLPEGCKSVALGLIFQDYSRTLTEQDVDEAVARILAHLDEKLGASVRG